MKTPRRRVLDRLPLALALAGLVGCTTPPTQPEATPDGHAGMLPEAPAPAVAPLSENVTPADYELQQRRGRRYRYRRIVIGGVRYYVPYFAIENYYLPDYLRYDADWYYVYAYTGPNFTGERRLIRIRRDRVRDREWNDRRDWNRDWSDFNDWRDGERDGWRDRDGRRRGPERGERDGRGEPGRRN